MKPPVIPNVEWKIMLLLTAETCGKENNIINTQRKV
jgi:hypothetical protein